MKKIYVLLLAFIAGFVLAFIAAGVHSLFFVFLPVIAFAFGYFSSWRRGLFCGFLLFAGYTFGISIIWWGFDSPNLLYPFPYIAAFIFGGFSFLLIGALAPKVRKGVGKAGSIIALVVLAAAVGWCGYSALPHYSYYYQVALQSTQDLTDLELYLPVGTVSGRPYEGLYSRVLEMPGGTTENFTQEIVDTEQGKMLKLTIPALKKDNVPVPRYTANIIFRQNKAPYKLLQLMPKNSVTQVNRVTWRRVTALVTSHESRVVERFDVPVKITSSTAGPIKLTLWNRTDRAEAVNFTYNRLYPYTERITYDIQTNGEWASVPVEATVVTEIRGISD